MQGLRMQVILEKNVTSSCVKKALAHIFIAKYLRSILLLLSDCVSSFLFTHKCVCVCARPCKMFVNYKDKSYFLNTIYFHNFDS